MGTCPHCARSLDDNGRCAVCHGDEVGASTHLRPEIADVRPETDSDSVAPGRIADRYLVRHRLGSGSFGEVYAAFDEVLEREIALKRIRLDQLAGGQELTELRARSLREAQVAAQLRHPNIVAIHDVIATDSECLIVMELIEGRTLEEVLKTEGRMSLAGVRTILAQLASALDYAHERKVVHRDIKPANIMLDSSGRVQVMDFGIAKAESSGQLTATGLVVGTPNYMSPEQARGEALDGRSDIFSMACIFYECLAGSRPFAGTSVTATLLKVVSEPPAPLDYVAMGLDPGIAPVVEKGLSKERDSRFETAASFIAAIDDVANDSLVAAPTLASNAGPRGAADPDAPQPESPISLGPDEGATVRSFSGTVRHVTATSPRGHRRLVWAGIGAAATVVLLLVVLGRPVADRESQGVAASEPAALGVPFAGSDEADPGPLASGSSLNRGAPADGSNASPGGLVPESHPSESSSAPPRSALTRPGPSSQPPKSTGSPLAQDNETPTGSSPRRDRQMSLADHPTRRREGQVIQALRRLHARQVVFKQRHGVYASGQDISQKLEERRRGERRARSTEWAAAGYHFRLDGSADAYVVVAVPTPSAPEGSRSFYLDETGILRGADHGGLPANPDDPVIP